MFGYIKLDSYAPKQLKTYFSQNYCFLCRALDRHYGLLARLPVSFDVTLFAVLFSKPNYLGKLEKVRCVRSNALLKELLRDEFAKKIAALNLALAAGEILDNLEDGDKWYAKPAYTVFSPIFKKVKSDYPRLWQLVEEGHEKMRLVEKDNGTLEEIETAFSDLIESITKEVFEVTDKARLSNICYVAKMLYFLDAVDDLDDDIRTGSYNALSSFGSKNKLVAENYDYLREHLRALHGAVLPIQERSVNVATVNRVVNFGIPEVVVSITAKGVM